MLNLKVKIILLFRHSLLVNGCNIERDRIILLINGKYDFMKYDSHSNHLESSEIFENSLDLNHRNLNSKQTEPSNSIGIVRIFLL